MAHSAVRKDAIASKVLTACAFEVVQSHTYVINIAAEMAPMPGKTRIRSSETPR